MYNNNLEYTELVDKLTNELKNKIKNKKLIGDKKIDFIFNYIHNFVDDNYFEIVNKFIKEYGADRLKSDIKITNTFIIDVANNFGL